MKFDFMATITTAAFAIIIGMTAGSILEDKSHDCPEIQDPITMIVDCPSHEGLIGKIVTEHHFLKLAFDDVTAKFNACVMDLAVERGELPPLPGGE